MKLSPQAVAGEDGTKVLAALIRTWCDLKIWHIQFNIQKFYLHDGPGIRDLVFMKGCPLRCQWCSNPESQRPHPEIAYNADQCIGFESCGLCQDVCPEKAISRGDSGRAKIDRSLCNNCGDCATVCPDRALEMIGREMSISEILDVVAVDDYSILMPEIVAAGPAGNFLSSDLTLKHFRQAYFQSAIFPSFTMEDWSSDGCPKAENYLSRYTNDMIEDLSISDESFAMIEKGEAFITRNLKSRLKA